MNNGAVDRETNTPHHHESGARQRSHTAGWVLLFVVAAGGLSMAAAHQMDPAGFDAKVDAVVASAHDLGDKISDQFDNKKPAVNMDVTALSNTSQSTATAATPPAAAASASLPEQPAPQAGTTPAPQQLLQQQPTGAGTAAEPGFKPVPVVTQAAAPQVSKSTLAPPTTAAPLPMQAQPVSPVTPLTPVQPLQPGTQSPPIPPATQPPVTQTPPPPPPTQGPQAMQDQQAATTTAQSDSDANTTH